MAMDLMSLFGGGPPQRNPLDEWLQKIMGQRMPAMTGGGNPVAGARPPLNNPGFSRPLGAPLTSMPSLSGIGGRLQGAINTPSLSGIGGRLQGAINTPSLSDIGGRLQGAINTPGLDGNWTAPPLPGRGVRNGGLNDTGPFPGMKPPMGGIGGMGPKMPTRPTYRSAPGAREGSGALAQGLLGKIFGA